MLGWFRDLRRRRPAHLEEGLERWSALAAPDELRPWKDIRFVVADTETTGLDPSTADLLAIGACRVEDNGILLSPMFETLVRPAALSEEANVLVHSIGHGRQRSGADAGDALLAWLEYAGRPVFAGFHAQFDASVLARHTARTLRVRLPRDWLDVRVLLVGLFSHPEAAARDLDGWCEFFAVSAYERHGALADAVATAQLLLVALGEASRRDLRTVRDLRRFHDRTLTAMARQLGGTAGF